MKEGREIVGIAVPFAAGVLAADIILGNTFLGSGAGTVSGLVIASASFLLSVFLMYFSVRRGSILVLTFLFLGIMCRFNASLSWTCPRSGYALDGLVRHIEGIPFAHSDTASLLEALLTGRRTGLSREITNSFRMSGASHILALSGLHLGVIYAVLNRALKILGNGRMAEIIRCTTIISASAFYMESTGASPSIVRAFLFIAINELSKLFPGRRRDPLNVYFTALTIQLAIKPEVISSLGFQLSYLAILGILLVFPTLDSWYPEGAKFNPLKLIWTSAALSVSCQIFTAPLVWFRFHTFPVHFLLTNLIALPLTELLISCSVFLLLLNALGFCPDILVRVVDFLASSLCSSMKIIASM